MILKKTASPRRSFAFDTVLTPFAICVIIDWVMKMENNKAFPARKKNRLQNYDYSSYGAYFITVCTKDKRNYFWKNVGATIGRPQDIELSLYGEIVSNAIKNISSMYPALLVERYVIMPNHIHLLLRICSDELGRPMVAPTMSRVINQLKGYASKQIGKPIWQKSFHDHIIRNQKDYEEHINYIYYNPVRWHLDELYIEERGTE